MDRMMVEQLLQRVDLEDRNGRKRFLTQVDRLIAQQQFVNQPLDLLDILRREEIECLLKESLIARYDYGVRIVNFLAQTGYRNEPDVDENGRPSSSRTTALHHAASRLAYSRAHPVVHALFTIYHRYDVNYTDVASGLTHFHIACKFGCEEAVRRFLELGQYPDLVATNTVDPPLHLALIFGHENVARSLLQNRANPNLTDKFGSTALHVICERHNDAVSLTNMLFDTRAEDAIQVDAADVYDKTPLHLATDYGNINVVEILLRKGADPNLTDWEGTTPLHFICTKEADDDFVDKFFDICAEVEKRVLINAQDTKGDTPLHLALDNGLIETAQILVEEGAYLLSTNEKGATPLHNACKSNYPGIDLTTVVRTFFANLIGRPSNIDSQDERGYTAYHVALRNDHKDVAILLLESGANTTRANDEGFTPLHTVCRRYDFNDLTEILSLIDDAECELNLRAKVTARDSLGHTALDSAIRRLSPYNGNGQMFNFRFDTERYLPYPYGNEQISMVWEKKLDATCNVMTIVEYFWERGCRLNRRQLLAVIDFFYEYALFKRSREFRRRWYDDQEFVSRARTIMVSPEMSLNDLVRLPLEQASSSEEIDYNMLKSVYPYLNEWPKGPKDACIVHFCEMMSWRFFLESALYYLRNLMDNQVSRETCYRILKTLKIRHYYKICRVGAERHLL